MRPLEDIRRDLAALDTGRRIVTGLRDAERAYQAAAWVAAFPEPGDRARLKTWLRHRDARRGYLVALRILRRVRDLVEREAAGCDRMAGVWITAGYRAREAGRAKALRALVDDLAPHLDRWIADARRSHALACPWTTTDHPIR